MVIAILTLLGLVAVGLAGADRPPPPGFLLWVAAAGAAGLGVWWRAPGWRGRVLPAVRDGGLLGLAAGVVFSLTGGEPSIETPWWAPIVFTAVMTAVGAVIGALVGVLLRAGREGV